jgi:hypothetical protein
MLRFRPRRNHNLPCRRGRMVPSHSPVDRCQKIYFSPRTYYIFQYSRSSVPTFFGIRDQNRNVGDCQTVLMIEEKNVRDLLANRGGTNHSSQFQIMVYLGASPKRDFHVVTISTKPSGLTVRSVQLVRFGKTRIPLRSP